MLTKTIQAQKTLHAEIEAQIQALRDKQVQAESQISKLAGLETKMQSAAQMVEDAIAEIKSCCPEDLSEYRDFVAALFTGDSAVDLISVVKKDEQQPTAAAALVIVEEEEFNDPFPMVEATKSVEGHPVLGRKVITPEGLTGMAARMEPLHKEMIMVEFTNGSSPYFEKDLVLANPSSDISPRPDSFYYAQPLSEPRPEFNIGDWVELPSGGIDQVTQVESVGGRFYIEVQGHGYRPTDLKSAEDKSDSREDAPQPYDTAEKIAEALADTEEIDTHLMAIANVLDDCPQEEIAGRVWFFVQNIPAEHDDRILRYLPKSLCPEWDNQRKAQFEEARESILPKPTQPHFFEVNDLVETPASKVGYISEIQFDIKTGRIAVVGLPGGAEKHATDHLKYIGKYQAPIEDATVEITGAIAAPVAAATKKERKPKVKPGAASEVLKCKNWEEIRAIASNNAALIKEAATSAHTKSEKELIENLPELIRDYIQETQDASDLEWLPNYIKTRVQILLKERTASV